MNVPPDERILQVRVPSELLDEFKAIVAARDQTMSRELRAFMRRYVDEHRASSVAKEE